MASQNYSATGILNRGVCAVLVTFFPRTEDILGLALIREQVQFVVIVNNGSDQRLLALLREPCQQLHIHLIENGCNLGIAAALNIGIRWALARHFKWVIFFDQDSSPTTGMVKRCFCSLRAILNRKNSQS